jgi:hypothetical protein
LVLPSAALATQGLWDDAIGTTGQAGNSSKNCDPAHNYNNTCYFDVDQTDGDTHVTPILANMGRCENLSYAWIGDIAVKGEFDNDLECFELFCAAIDATDDCALKLSNATLDGNPATATDTSAVRGTDAGRVYCRATMAEAGTFGRIRMSCWQNQSR